MKALKVMSVVAVAVFVSLLIFVFFRAEWARASTGGAAAPRRAASGLARSEAPGLPLHPKTYASYPVVSTANSSGLFEVANTTGGMLSAE